MEKIIRFIIKAALIGFLLILVGLVGAFKSRLGALPLSILYLGLGAAIVAIYKYKGKSSAESTKTTLNKDI